MHVVGGWEGEYIQVEQRRAWYTCTGQPGQTAHSDGKPLPLTKINPAARVDYVSGRVTIHVVHMPMEEGERRRLVLIKESLEVLKSRNLNRTGDGLITAGQLETQRGRTGKG